MGQKNFFLDIMNRKEFFLDKKNEVFKQWQKPKFFQRG